MTKEQIYNTFILAHLNYCSAIWHLCGKTSTKKIQCIQQCVLRFIYIPHYLSNVTTHTIMSEELKL